MQAWQESDSSLDQVREFAELQDENKGGKNAHFYRKGELVYRHWHPCGEEEDDVQAVEQLVLPMPCRPLVLRLA